MPQLTEDIAAGKVKARSLKGRDLRLKPAKGRDEKRGMEFQWAAVSRVAQQPSLFDFTKAGDTILLLAPMTKDK